MRTMHLSPGYVPIRAGHAHVMNGSRWMELQLGTRNQSAAARASLPIEVSPANYELRIVAPVDVAEQEAEVRIAEQRRELSV